MKTALHVSISNVFYDLFVSFSTQKVKNHSRIQMMLHGDQFDHMYMKNVNYVKSEICKVALDCMQNVQFYVHDAALHVHNRTTC